MIAIYPPVLHHRASVDASRLHVAFIQQGLGLCGAECLGENHLLPSCFANLRIANSIIADCETPNFSESCFNRRFASWDIRKLVCIFLFIKKLYHKLLYKQAPKYMLPRTVPHCGACVAEVAPALRTLAPHASAGVASRSEADVAGGTRETKSDKPAYPPALKSGGLRWAIRSVILPSSITSLILWRASP
jgi:hypothetical protein